MAIWVVDGVFRICRQPPIGVSNTVLCGVVIYLGLLRSERQIFNHAWVFLRSERQCCPATSLIYTPETHQCGSMMQNALPLRLQKDPYTRRNLPLRLHIEGGSNAKNNCAGIFGHIFGDCSAVGLHGSSHVGSRNARCAACVDVRDEWCALLSCDVLLNFCL